MDQKPESVNVTALEVIDRSKMSDLDHIYCHVRMSTNGSSTDWTYKSYLGWNAFAARATIGSNGIITLRIRSVGEKEKYETGIGSSEWSVSQGPCPDYTFRNSSVEFLFLPQVTVMITTIGIEQDLRQLEVAVLDMLHQIGPPASIAIELQDRMFRSYYAGRSGNQAFVPRQIEIAGGTIQITTISGVAVIGFGLTIVGCFISFLVLIFLRTSVRVTSVSYISRLYSGRDAEYQDSEVMGGKIDYIGTKRADDGCVYATPVQVKRDFVP